MVHPFFPYFLSSSTTYETINRLTFFSWPKFGSRNGRTKRKTNSERFFVCVKTVYFFGNRIAFVRNVLWIQSIAVFCFRQLFEFSAELLLCKRQHRSEQNEKHKRHISFVDSTLISKLCCEFMRCVQFCAEFILKPLRIAN